MKKQMFQILKYGGYLSGTIIGTISIKNMYEINTKISSLNKKISQNEKEQIYELKESDYINYPWSTNFSTLSPSQDWEMKKIKIKGNLGKSRFLIQQEKNGKQGYLVFTGLTTALIYGLSPNEEIMERMIIKRKGIMVCLGWVPVEDTSKAYAYKYLETEDIVSEEDMEKKNLFEVFRDPYTNFIYQGMDPDDLEDEEKTFKEVELGKVISKEFVFEGYLRKPEKPFLFGKRNDEYYGFYDFANLDRMTGFYKFINEGSRLYYLEKSKSYKVDEKIEFPIPLNEDHLKSDIEDLMKETYYRKFKVCTVLSGLLLSACSFI